MFTLVPIGILLLRNGQEASSSCRTENGVRDSEFGNFLGTYDSHITSVGKINIKFVNRSMEAS